VVLASIAVFENDADWQIPSNSLSKCGGAARTRSSLSSLTWSRLFVRVCSAAQHLWLRLADRSDTQNVPPLEPPPSQAPAAYVLTMFAEVAQDAPRLVKLNKSIALHRLLVVFISSNPAYYVVVPSLEMLEQCLSTPGLEGFHRSFENEGGFALLAKTLPGIWRDDIQGYVFRMMLGKDAVDDAKGTVKCPGLVSCLTGALDVLLQQAAEDESSSSGRPSQVRTRSGTVTSVRSIALSPIMTCELRALLEGWTTALILQLLWVSQTLAMIGFKSFLRSSPRPTVPRSLSVVVSLRERSKVSFRH
jgi:hypothetical protein